MLKCVVFATGKTNPRARCAATSYHLDKEVSRYFNKKTFVRQKKIWLSAKKPGFCG
jgi:hypothetical protein